MTALVTDYPDLARPDAFTQQGLGWVPWLEPVAEDDLTDVQREALIEPARAKMPYFRLLARDPAALHARTLTDLDIFYNVTGGIGRAERELAAAATSRPTAACSARRCTPPPRPASRVARPTCSACSTRVQADLGDETWNAVTAASVALAETPLAFGGRHRAAARRRPRRRRDRRRHRGAAFFNWANRLMLSLGEPEVPTRQRGNR
jgi:uncharacterized peroxidase-related enzyme